MSEYEFAIFEDNHDYDDDYDDDYGNETAEDERCVFGEHCLCPHYFHTAADCFTKEMAEAWAAEYEECEEIPTGLGGK